MYFTLAVSAATAAGCAALVRAAQGIDPRIMPGPGPALVAWRSPDQHAAVLYWGRQVSPGPRVASPDDGPEDATDGQRAAASHAGTIWAEQAIGDTATVCARTGLARVDPVYLADIPGAVVVSDRACWAAAVTGRLGDHDPAMVGAFLSLGYPVGAATPFRHVRALGGGQRLRVTGGRLIVTRARDEQAEGDRPEGRCRPAGTAVNCCAAATRRPRGAPRRPWAPCAPRSCSAG